MTIFIYEKILLYYSAHAYFYTNDFVHTKTNLHRNKWMWFLKIEYMKTERALYLLLNQYALGSNELWVRRMRRVYHALQVSNVRSAALDAKIYQNLQGKKRMILAISMFSYRKNSRKTDECFAPINENERISTIDIAQMANSHTTSEHISWNCREVSDNW